MSRNMLSLRSFGYSRAWLRDRRGLAAIEFALLVPVILVPLYFGALELGLVLNSDRRAAAVAAAAADLAAQSEIIDNGEIDDILEVSEWIMQPFPVEGMSIVLTGVSIDADDNIEVDWSRARNGSAHSSGAAFELPAGFDEAGYVVVAEVTYPYTVPVVNETYELEHTFYAAARFGYVCNADVDEC